VANAAAYIDCPGLAGSHLDHSLSTEVRVAKLIAATTLEERINQLTNAAPAIERLGIPAYNCTFGTRPYLCSVSPVTPALHRCVELWPLDVCKSHSLRLPPFLRADQTKPNQLFSVRPKTGPQGSPTTSMACVRFLRASA
jgi:hypothetical protein